MQNIELRESSNHNQCKFSVSRQEIFEERVEYARSQFRRKANGEGAILYRYVMLKLIRDSFWVRKIELYGHSCNFRPLATSSGGGLRAPTPIAGLVRRRQL